MAAMISQATTIIIVTIGHRGEVADAVVVVDVDSAEEVVTMLEMIKCEVAGAGSLALDGASGGKTAFDDAPENGAEGEGAGKEVVGCRTRRTVVHAL